MFCYWIQRYEIACQIGHLLPWRNALQFTALLHAHLATVTNFLPHSVLAFSFFFSPKLEEIICNSVEDLIHLAD